MSLENKRIFLLEDDTNNLVIISAILRRNGATVFNDTWGSNTVYLIKRYLPIDVILLDLMLPDGVTGYDVFNQIKATPQLAHIPVVAVTAKDPDTEMKIAREKGFSGYISKPIRSQPFAQAIVAVIEGAEVWGEVKA